MFSTGCVSQPVRAEIVWRIPELSFPEFPVLSGGEDCGDGTVRAPESYFRELLVFRALYEALAESYEDYRELYGGGN